MHTTKHAAGNKATVESHEKLAKEKKIFTFGILLHMLTFTCERSIVDMEPPVFLNCPSQKIHQTFDPSSTLTRVIWPKITVSDNSGQQVTMTPTSAHTVTSIGGSFPVGTHIVKFDAKDAAGNKATQCIFVVVVESMLYLVHAVILYH